MDINLDDKQIKYIKYILTERLKNIQKALDDNKIFYEDELAEAFGELDVINSIIK